MRSVNKGIQELKAFQFISSKSNIISRDLALCSQHRDPPVDKGHNREIALVGARNGILIGIQARKISYRNDAFQLFISDNQQSMNFLFEH